VAFLRVRGDPPQASLSLITRIGTDIPAVLNLTRMASESGESVIA
jgi:hypothetical protein